MIIKAWEVEFAAKRMNFPSVELVGLRIANVNKISWKVIKEMEKDRGPLVS